MARWNPIRYELNARSLPPGTTKAEYYRALILRVRNGQPLPSGWQVELNFRNPGSRRSALTWQWDGGDFEDVVDESEGVGLFNTFLLEHLEEQLQQAVARERYDALWQRRQRLETLRKGRKR